MATEAVAPAVANGLPDYLQAAKPNPITNRAPWYKNTAPTYAGIFLWFVFWDSMPANGLELAGLGVTLVAILVAGLICHFLFYLVPGLFGLKTGLPLYIIGSSTFGALGGLLMPGFLMGLLQFGWLAVNTYFSSQYLAEAFTGETGGPVFYVICIIWAGGAAFVGLKGIQYVAKVATYLPLIPLAVLVLALVKFGGSAPQYRPTVVNADSALILTGLYAMVGAIVGFFATAGAAGVDFGMNNRNTRDVNLGGIVGIVIAVLVTAGVSTVGVAGAQVTGDLPNKELNQELVAGLQKAGASQQEIDAKVHEASFRLTNGLKRTLPQPWPTVILVGLTIAAFPGACFSSFIAANSFKTVMPRVNSFLSVGIGALASIILAVTKVAGDLGSVFGLIGASFGPICGAMFVDYIISGRKWSGPRAGFNPAGWVAWLLGFFVGIMPNLHSRWDVIPDLPAAPVFAFLVGAFVYYFLAMARLQTRVLPYQPAAGQQLA